MTERASEGRFLKPEKLQNHSKEGKGKEKKKERGEGKEEKKKKNKGSTLSFNMIMATLEIVFCRKKLLDAKGPFGDNVIKNPARYIRTILHVTTNNFCLLWKIGGSYMRAITVCL